MKRVYAMVLAVIMAVGMCLPAYAADEKPGSITIENAVAGQEYTVYRLLDLESYNADTGAYAYKANANWKAWLETQTDYVKFDAQGYATWVDNADVAAFAVAAQAYAKANGIDPSAEPVTATGETVAFEGLDLGYYLVDTTLGTICSLNTTNPDAKMKEKNVVPSIKKEVQEDSNDAWGEKNDADINQIVKYRVTVTVQPGAENYIVHDTMSEGLTFLQVDSVTVAGADVAVDNYAITNPGTENANACTFEVAFANEYVGSLAAGTQIVIEYSARLNDDAKVGLDGNPNEVKLQYGDENKVTFTPPIKVITYTWDAKVVKYTVKNGQEVVLAGAVFQLCTDQAGANAIKFHELGNNTYQVCADQGCDADHVDSITTDETGAFMLVGLDADTYYLNETKAPAGYNALPSAVEVVVVGGQDAADGNMTYETVEKKVENKTGTILPDTGGMGTAILYGVGALLIVGAAVLLVTRRRAASQE